MMARQAFLCGALLVVPCAAWSQGVPLGGEFRVNTYTMGYQAYPAVAAAPAGDFVVAWAGVQNGALDPDVFAQRFAASGSPLGPEFRVNSFTTGQQLFPVLASDPSGNFVILWNSDGQDGSSFGVFGQRFAASGAPLGSEFRVNTFTTSFQALPSVAFDPLGGFVTVWQGYGQDGASWGVFGQRYGPAGVPLGPEFRVNSSTSGFQYFPALAADGAGNFVVAWQDEGLGGAGVGVFGQRYAASGSPLGPEFRVNTYTTGLQIYPSVAADTTGNFIVVWVSHGQDGSLTGIFAQRWSAAGQALGPEFRANTYTPDHQYLTDVASDASGNFVLVWASDEQDGSGPGVFAQRYEGGGAPLGPEFRVNTFTPDGQGRPSVGADAPGRFVVVWDSRGSQFGIFGQRYAPILPVELTHFRVE